MSQIYGLSLSRPWPFAFKHGKRVENRSWRPAGRYKGAYIALHAAKSYDSEGRDYIAEATGLDVPTNKECPHSVIFAVCRWNGVIILPTPETHERGLIDTGTELASDQEKWFFGPYGWLLENYVELPEPVPCVGARGLWGFGDKPYELAAVREQWQRAKEVAKAVIK